MGIEPGGGVYEFARNRLGQGELAGATFSADGRVLFLAIQYPGLTFAISGPFRRADVSAARRLSAGEPGVLGPSIPAELDAAAHDHGWTALEAAAFDRLGVPLG